MPIEGQNGEPVVALARSLQGQFPVECRGLAYGAVSRAFGCVVAFDSSATDQAKCGTPVVIDAATGVSCCIVAKNALA